MRKVMLIGGLALIMSLGVANPAVAGSVPAGSSAFGASSVTWQQRYLSWLFGSDTNPLMQDGFCGQTIDGVLFLNAAVIPNFDATCTVEPGTKLLASPGGTIEWEPTNGTTDEQLLAQLAVDEAAIQNAAATLDGRTLDVQDGFAHAGAYTIPVADNSFIKTVDPGFPSDLTEARVASSAWIVRFTPLTPGSHTLVVSDTIAGDPFVATFHINVTHP
jgi:hypothetical protein